MSSNPEPWPKGVPQPPDHDCGTVMGDGCGFCVEWISSCGYDQYEAFMDQAQYELGD